jgi:mannose-6-phosphate isomerase-like protein (cupin superfamily)
VSRSFDLESTFVHLGAAGGATPVALTPAFWRESGAGGYDRLLGCFAFRSSDDLHSRMQEMHPEADEVIVLLEGAIDVIVDGEEPVSLEVGHAAIVPRGAWHRLEMRAPGKLLFVNSRTGMQHRDA